MNHRPTIQFRFRTEAHKRAGMSLNEYILRKIEGPRLDLSKRKI